MFHSRLSRNGSEGNPLYAVLSLNILKSLNAEQIGILRSLDIHTLGDLLSYRPIHYAQLIVSVASGEIAHDLNITALLDTAYENTPYQQLPSVGAVAIEGIGEPSAAILLEYFNVQTIGDLADFKPYREAQSYLQPDGYEFNEPASAPPELMPRATGSIHNVARFTEFVRQDLVQLPELNLTYDTNRPNYVDSPLSNLFVTHHSSGTYPEFHLGYALLMKQFWTNMGTSLGEIIHSLALAPGESRNIAIIDWKRRQLGKRQEDTEASEQLQNQLIHTRALDEVTRSTAIEHQWGGTDISAGTLVTGAATVVGAGITGGIAGSIPGIGIGAIAGGVPSSPFAGVGALPGAVIGGATGFAVGGIAASLGAAALVSANGQIGTIRSDTNGLRSVSGSVNQDILDVTQQKASSVRSLWSNVVVSDYQGEEGEFVARNITNYNHSHALTIQYYEVLQHYRVQIAPQAVEPLFFLPFRPLTFDIDLIATYWDVLQAGIENPDQLKLIDDVLNGRSGSNEPITTPLSELSLREIRVSVSGGSLPMTTLSSLSLKLKLLNAERPIPQYGVTPGLFSSEMGESVAPMLSNVQGLSFSRSYISTWMLQTELVVNIVIEMDVHDADGFVTTVRRDVNQFTIDWKQGASPTFLSLASVLNELSQGSEASASVPSIDIVANIVRFFNNRCYRFTRLLLLAIEREQLIDLVESLQMEDDAGNAQPLTRLIDPSPYAITENTIVFKMRRTPSFPRHWDDLEIVSEFLASLGEEFKIAQQDVQGDDVYLPTSGVFAEAILGRSNASEKIDITRFWNWQDSPIPHQAPEIQSVSTERAVQEALGTEPTVPANVLNVINPPAMPDPTGLAASLQAVQNGNMFRDMSGADNLTTVLGKLADVADNTARTAGTLAGQAGKDALQSATKIADKVADMAKQQMSEQGLRAKNITEEGGMRNDRNQNPMPDLPTAEGETPQPDSTNNEESEEPSPTPRPPEEPPPSHPLPTEVGEIPGRRDAVLDQIPFEALGSKATDVINGQLIGRVLLTNFGINQSDLRDDHQIALQQLATLLAMYPHTYYYVEGHASRTGGATSNLLLSQDRARTVNHYLVELGITAEALDVLGVGEAYPIRDQRSLPEDPFNRSVMIAFSIPDVNFDLQLPKPERKQTETETPSSNWEMRAWAGSGIGENYIGLGGGLFLVELTNLDSDESEMFVLADRSVAIFNRDEIERFNKEDFTRLWVGVIQTIGRNSWRVFASNTSTKPLQITDSRQLTMSDFDGTPCLVRLKSAEDDQDLNFVEIFPDGKVMIEFETLEARAVFDVTIFPSAGYSGNDIRGNLEPVSQTLRDLNPFADDE